MADLHRRSQVSDQCNSKYADAIASAQVAETLQEVFGNSCNAIRKKETQRLAGRTARRIRLLRGYGLIRKSPYVNRFVLTEKGQKFSSALLSASSVEVKEVMELAS